MTKEQEKKLEDFIYDVCSEISGKITDGEGNFSFDKLSDDDLYNGGFLGILINMGCVQEYAKRHPDMLDEGEPTEYFNRVEELLDEYCPEEETENES